MSTAVRFCPKCETERSPAEFFCQGEVAGTPCEWNLSGEPLREAGWRGDARLARFGCTAVAAHLWGLPTWLPAIGSAEGRAFFESFFGRPLAEVLDQWAATLAMVLDLGDEARALLPTVA